MRLKIDLEIPQWTKWLVGGIAIGLVLGLGAWRVYAAVSVKTNWQAGNILAAADLNDNFQKLQDEINGLSSTVQTLQTSNAALASRPQAFSAHILSTGAVENVKGDWIVSSQRNGTTDAFEYEVNFRPGVFAVSPNCTCSVLYTSGCGSATTCGTNLAPSTGKVRLLVRDVLGSGYLGICDMNLICI